MAVLYSIIWLHLIYSISFLFIVVLVICGFSRGSFSGRSLLTGMRALAVIGMLVLLKESASQALSPRTLRDVPSCSEAPPQEGQGQALHAKEVQKKVIGLQHTRPPEGAGRTFSGSLSHGLWSYLYRRVRNTRGMDQPFIVLWLWASHFAQAMAFPPHHRGRYHQPLWVWGLKHRC